MTSVAVKIRIGSRVSTEAGGAKRAALGEADRARRPCFRRIVLQLAMSGAILGFGSIHRTVYSARSCGLLG
jgi:hypothetical protein